MNEISEKYKKYIIEIKLNGKKKFFISGMDISKEDADFLLIDSNGKILIFNDVHLIEKFILETKGLLDKDNFLNWIRELKDYKPYVSYDIDKITQILQVSNPLKELNKDELSQIIDLINLIGDYSYQVDDKNLILLLEAKSIDLIKELFMDKYIWKAIEDSHEIDLEPLFGNFPFEDFKADFENLFNLFVKQLSDDCN
ncbi:MAG: hypothetical protein Q8T08_20855 [Ignavibacteria bacterium]|nr:hypothetical protein [Ignavibacteria bacterium]